MKHASIAPRKIVERIFGGGVNTPPDSHRAAREGRTEPVEGKYTTDVKNAAQGRTEANTRGRKIMARLTCGTLAAAMLLTVAGCSGSKTDNSLADKLDTEDAIEAYITERVSEGCWNILYEENPISCLIVSEQANVTIRTSSDFCIPSAAEELLPIVTEALAENDTTLGKVSVTYYRTNSSGVVDGSMVDWTTRDGEKGTFASEPDNTTQTGYTVEDLQEYYKDYAELVERLRNGEE